jgi:hypothetical protein
MPASDNIPSIARPTRGKAGILLLLGIYSLVLLGVEWRTNQDFVRNFFTDITGPVPFFAINTSLCTFLLWGMALVFAICVACQERGDYAVPQRRFFIAQILVFGWLGLDERFKFHEWAAGLLDVPDEYVLALEGAAAAGCFVMLGRRWISRRAAGYLMIAIGFAGVMFLVDAFAPSELALRLSVEDLTKTWAAVFLFFYAWECLREQLDQLVATPPSHAP